MTEDNTVDYTKCCLFAEGSCGEHFRSRLTGLFKCDKLTEVFANGFTEKHLIESRIHVDLSNEQVICAFHKQKYGRYRYVTTQCLHPDLQKATRDQYEKINKCFPCFFPVSGQLCRIH